MNFNNQHQGHQGFYGQQSNGYRYAQPQVPKMTQPLTEEEMKELKNTGTEFSLEVTNTDKLKAFCTHKNHQGQFTIHDRPDGSSFCSTCGEEFRLVDMPEQSVREAVGITIDILQTIKTQYVDISENVARQFFQFIPLLKKVPQLYTIANQRFNQYDRGFNLQQNPNQYSFNMLGAITGPSNYNPGLQYQQGNMGGAPNYNNGGPVNNGGNPFGGQQQFQNNGQPPQNNNTVVSSATFNM